MEKLDVSKGATSMYIQISKNLREKVIKKEYPLGLIIPSEAELQKQYGVSRMTARLAIQELEKEGLVERKRGKGTVVIYQKRIEESLTAIRSFTDEMLEKKIEPGTKFAHIEIVKATKKLADIFKIQENEPIYRLERVRSGDGLPIVIFESYFSVNRHLPLDDAMYENSVYTLLKTLGYEPVRVIEQFDCIMPDSRMKELLEIKKAIPIFRRIRRSYDVQGHILEYTFSYYRSDRYSYTIEINNRK